MVQYEPVKVTIDAPGLAEVIIDVIVRHHGLPDSIVSDRGSVFTLKFWSSLCYFPGIKRRLSTGLHPRIDGQTERQNSTMEAYLRAFVNYEQDDRARLLPMAEFAYNNAYHDKHAKPRSYASGEKVWLNSNYIKTKRNRKLEAEFFGPFRVLHLVRKQAYKLELPKRWRIHDVFHVSLL